MPMCIFNVIYLFITSEFSHVYTISCISFQRYTQYNEKKHVCVFKFICILFTVFITIDFVNLILQINYLIFISKHKLIEVYLIKQQGIERFSRCIR